MNYKQAYTLLRSYGHPADEVREVLDKAEIAPAKLGNLTVAFTGEGGFVIKEKKGE